MPLELINAIVIDAVQPVPRAGRVTVRDGRIEEIDYERPGATSGSDATVLDLDGAYLIPGLWDAHSHLFPLAPRPASLTLPARTLDYAAIASEGLRQGGVTGMRSAGMPAFIDVALREAAESGRWVGPRIAACGYFLTTTGGHLPRHEIALVCDGPTEIVRAVRDQIEHRVDHIKLNLSGGIMGPFWDQPKHLYWLEEELDAAFRLARQRDYPVMAHATNPAAVKAALRLGAHSLEHGYAMDEECIELLLEKDAWYVPTLCISHLTPSQAVSEFERQWVTDHPLPADLWDRADAAADEHRHWFRAALQAGVKMALGSDAGPQKDAVHQEMELWVKSGATPWQTLQAATTHAAALCGMSDRVGTIEAGKIADLVAVRGNPLDDINHVRAVDLVVKDGIVAADHRAADA
ncbi:MAG: amidohydrolase family protein [Chloroflexi bacterium]|nr:amidohydrolase family protein [Chloroflexota bacterium]